MKTMNFYWMHITLCAFVIGTLSSCSDKEKAQDEKKRTIVVSTMKVVTEATGLPGEYIGVIEEESGADLSFQVAGNVNGVYVSEGTNVKKGQLLAQLDRASLQSSNDAAQASLKHAQDAYNRMKKLYDKQSLPEIKFVEVETKLQQAKSMAQIAAKNLQDATLTAPFDGIIGKRTVEPGENAVPGKPVFKLLKTNNVHATFSVPEKEIALVNKHNDAEVIMTSMNNKRLSGPIIEKGVMTSSLSHGYGVKVKLQNTDGSLLPGMVCKVLVDREEAAPVIVVPNRALQINSDGSRFVWAVVDGKATAKQVETGELADNGVVVVSGLQPNDEVITDGYQKVSEGMNVQVR